MGEAGRCRRLTTLPEPSLPERAYLAWHLRQRQTRSALRRGLRTVRSSPLFSDLAQALGVRLEGLLLRVRLVACSAEPTAGHLKGCDIHFVLRTADCTLHLDEVLERGYTYRVSVEIHDVGMAA